MSFSPGDVVYVRFIFTSQAGSKRRPAVILSVPAYHASRQDAVMMPLTTQPPVYFGDVALSDWKEAGLPVPSNLKAVVQTLPRSAIDSKLGTLTPADFALAKNAIRAIIDLA